MAAENPLIKKMNSSDIIRLMEKLCVPESMIIFGNSSLSI